MEGEYTSGSVLRPALKRSQSAGLIGIRLRMGEDDAQEEGRSKEVTFSSPKTPPRCLDLEATRAPQLMSRVCPNPKRKSFLKIRSCAVI